jgi:MscS family membrane protein
MWLYRGLLPALLLLGFWSVWTNAQEAGVTNPPAVDTRPASDGTTNPLTDTLSNVEFLRETTFLGVPLWKYLASLIYIVLAFYAAKLVDLIVNGWLRRWASKTATRYDDLLLDLLRGPVKLVVFVILLHVGLGVFDWPPSAQAFLSKAMIVVVAFSITYVVLKVVDVLLGLWRDRYSKAEDRLFTEHLFPVIRKAVKAGLVIAAVMLTADNLGVKITSVLAGLSIGGLALGLAAQDTVANLFGAVSIFLDKPFRIGDRIKVESVDGMVESIGLRSTRVRGFDGILITIPNKTMGNATIINVTQRAFIRTEMNLGLTYDTPVDKVKRAAAILAEVFDAHPKTSETIVSFNRFADSALNLIIVHTWNGRDAKEHFAALQEMNLKIKERFAGEGIEFAFPTQTIHLKQG